MENIVYLDNSATTKPCKKAIEYMTRSLEENWGIRIPLLEEVVQE